MQEALNRPILSKFDLSGRVTRSRNNNSANKDKEKENQEENKEKIVSPKRRL